MKRKDFFILVTLCLLVFMGGLHERFIGSGIRSNFFVFHDYYHINNQGIRIEGRYVSNIINDLTSLITITTLLFLLYKVSVPRILKKIFLPFLIISLADIVDYVLFFQKLAHIKLLALVFLIAMYIYPLIKNKNK